MNKGLFTFTLSDKYTPDVVIRNSISQIQEATNGYVIGNIKEYNGHISSYSKPVGLTASLNAFQTTGTVHVDIQDELGAQNNKNNRFEVFLSVKGLDYYKYRMMFINYKDISYPVTIVLNEELAVAYNGKRQYNFEIDSMAELEEMMDKIINSDFMVSLLQNLINESLRQEIQATNFNES